MKNWRMVVNRRPGPDGYMNTKDDNYYLNGEDGIAGTHDDEKLYPGKMGNMEQRMIII